MAYKKISFSEAQLSENMKEIEDVKWRSILTLALDSQMKRRPSP